MSKLDKSKLEVNSIFAWMFVLIIGTYPAFLYLFNQAWSFALGLEASIGVAFSKIIPLAILLFTLLISVLNLYHLRFLDVGLEKFLVLKVYKYW